jgi:hypothetical protein
MLHPLSVELPIATVTGDAIKQTTAIKAVAAAAVRNRNPGVSLKSVPFSCYPTLASTRQTPHYRFATRRIFAPRRKNSGGIEGVRLQIARNLHNVIELDCHG